MGGWPYLAIRHRRLSLFIGARDRILWTASGVIGRHKTTNATNPLAVINPAHFPSIPNLMFLVIAAHLICVNLAGGAPLILIWLETPSRKSQPVADSVAARLGWWSICGLIAGSLMGLLVGTGYWSEEYSAAVQILVPKIKWAIAELVFSLVIMMGVALWWTKRPQVGRPLRWLRGFLNLLAGTNLLYHFPLLLLLLAQLRRGQLTSSEPITSSLFRQWITDPVVLARASHFVVASFAVTGAAMVLMAWLDTRHREPIDDDHRLAGWGARIALGASLLQVPVGVWIVTALPEAAQGRLMGKDLSALLAFVVAIIVTLGLLQHLASTAFGDKDRRNWLRIVWMMGLTIAVMTFVATRI